MAIKLQHVLEADDQFRRSAGLPRLDLPEHLWDVRDMRSTHSREQDFMAITAEVEVLRQQLKGKGMYTVPLAFPKQAPPNPAIMCIFSQLIQHINHQFRPWTNHS